LLGPEALLSKPQVLAGDHVGYRLGPRSICRLHCPFEELAPAESLIRTRLVGDRPKPPAVARPPKRRQLRQSRLDLGQPFGKLAAAADPGSGSSGSRSPLPWAACGTSTGCASSQPRVSMWNVLAGIDRRRAWRPISNRSPLHGPHRVMFLDLDARPERLPAAGPDRDVGLDRIWPFSILRVRGADRPHQAGAAPRQAAGLSAVRCRAR